MPVHPFLYPSSDSNRRRPAVNKCSVNGQTKSFIVMDTNLERDPNQIITKEEMRDMIHFEPSNIRAVVEIDGGEVGRPNRILLIFNKAITIPGITQKFSYLLMYFTFETIGISDDQRKALEGRKRELEDSAGSPSEKKVKKLDARPSRATKEKALARMRLPDSGINAITPDKLIKMMTVGKVVDTYVDAFTKASIASWPDNEEKQAKLSHAKLSRSEEEFMQVIEPSVIQQAGDPLCFYSSVERDMLLLMTRSVINYMGVVMFEDVDYVILVDPSNSAHLKEETKKEDNSKEIDLNSDEGDDPSDRVIVMFVQARPNVANRRYTFPGMSQLLQLREILIKAEIPFAGIEASLEDLDNIDLEYLCKEKPQDFEVVDGKIVDEVFKGLKPLMIDFQVSNNDSDIEYDDKEDVLDDVERKVKAIDKQRKAKIKALKKKRKVEAKKKKALETMLIAARMAAAMSDKDDVIATFEALPEAQRIQPRLEQMLEEAELLASVNKVVGKQEVEEESDEDESESDDEQERKPHVVQDDVGDDDFELPSISESDSDEDEINVVE